MAFDGKCCAMAGTATRTSGTASIKHVAAQRLLISSCFRRVSRSSYNEALLQAPEPKRNNGSPKMSSARLLLLHPLGRARDAGGYNIHRRRCLRHSRLQLSCRPEAVAQLLASWQGAFPTSRCFKGHPPFHSPVHLSGMYGAAYPCVPHVRASTRMSCICCRCLVFGLRLRTGSQLKLHQHVLNLQPTHK